MYRLGPAADVHLQAAATKPVDVKQRELLQLILLDIRHPLKDYDLQMLGYADTRGIPSHVLLTKADKLGHGARMQTLAAVRRELHERYGERVEVQVFSGESKLGVDEARGVIANWLELRDS